MISGGSKTSTGLSVTSSNALQATAVWACVRFISETIATLPLFTYRRLSPRGKTKAREHRLFSLLHDAPNPEMDAVCFKGTLQGHLCLRGNAYAHKVFNRGGELIELWPLRPDRMEIERVNGRIVYFYTVPGTGVRHALSQRFIWHIKGWGYNGLLGYSPISFCRESIGLALATEKYGSSFFGNGARPGGYLKYPQKLSPTAKENIKDSFETEHKGLDVAMRMAVLEEGMEWVQVGISPDDSQFLQTRGFQTEEISRIFNVKPHKINDLSKATFSNIEQQNIESTIDTIRPWAVRWELSANQQLLGNDPELFTEFLIDALMRGDQESRYKAYSVGRQWGWLSADDVRELENQNPLPDDQGNIYMVPLNMVPATQIEIVIDQRSEIRKRMFDVFRPIFRQAYERILARERADILRAAEKKQGEELTTYVDKFYTNHHLYMRKQLNAPIDTFIREYERSFSTKRKEIMFIEPINSYVASIACDLSGIDDLESCFDTRQIKENIEIRVNEWMEQLWRELETDA